jgi:hypothetical protein
VLQKGEEEVTYPFDMLYKYNMSFLPYVMMLYQLYREECERKDLEPPNLSEWVNNGILSLYQKNIGTIQFTPISRTIATIGMRIRESD